MKLINILTVGPDSYNARAFIFPLNKYRPDLLENNIKLDFNYKVSPSLVDADVLIIDSKFFKSWYADRLKEMYEFFEHVANKTKIIFFDTTDSSGYLLGDVLPYCDLYLKHQTYKDKNLYLNNYYGRRIYSDYFHRNFNITDNKVHEEVSNDISSKNDIKKIKTGWNTGLSNYSLMGEYYGKLYKYTGIKFPFQSSIKFYDPKNFRPNSIHSRMNTSYDKESVAFQRKLLQSKLGHLVRYNKLSRYRYFQELKTTRLVISPFGLGEITLKDFEAFIAGATLIKPSMDHIETWPNFYIPNETYVPCKWDLNDLEGLLQDLLQDKNKALNIAINGQNLYKKYLQSESSMMEFINHFKKLVLS